jgi:hypothetical protein
MLNNYNTDFQFASSYNLFSTNDNSSPHSSFVDLKTTNDEVTHKSMSQVPDLTTSWKFSDVSDTTSANSEVKELAASIPPLPPTKKGQHNTRQMLTKKMVRNDILNVGMLKWVVRLLKKDKLFSKFP